MWQTVSSIGLVGSITHSAGSDANAHCAVYMHKVSSDWVYYLIMYKRQAVFPLRVHWADSVLQ